MKKVLNPGAEIVSTAEKAMDDMARDSQWGDNDVLLCNKCGAILDPVRVNPGNPCPILDCYGYVKLYDNHGDFAVFINLLDRVGYTVNKYDASNSIDTDNREISIRFADCYWFPNPVPAGFELTPDRKDASDPEYPCHIYKGYFTDLPPERYASQLLKDKTALAKWILNLPHVKALFNR